MPIYEYKCPRCYRQLEILQRFEASPPGCAACRAKMEKQISRTSFILKGGGWFADSYSSTSPDPDK